MRTNSRGAFWVVLGCVVSVCPDLSLKQLLLSGCQSQHRGCRTFCLLLQTDSLQESCSCFLSVLDELIKRLSVVLRLEEMFVFFSCFLKQPQSQPGPVRIIPSQSAQPTSLPKPVPSVQLASRPALPPHTPHAAGLPSCPGRGKMAKFLNPDEMTSRDYYFDSYAHFGIHEVKRG